MGQSTRFEIQALPAPCVNVLIFVENQRTRSDQTHLASDDIEQLRQLIERVATQPPADSRYPGIIEDLEHSRVTAVLKVLVQVRDFVLSLLGIVGHRSELEDPERPIASAHPNLAKAQDRENSA